MLKPSLEEVKQFAKQYNTIPVFYEFSADNQTPLNIYTAFAKNSKNSFILESVSNGVQWDRYSFIGFSPEKEIRMMGNMAEIRSGDAVQTEQVEEPIAFLKKMLAEYRAPSYPDAPHFTGGLIGYFGYDTVRYVEKRLTNVPEDDIHMPDCHLFLYEELIAYDHLTSNGIVILNLHTDGDLGAQYAAAQWRAEELAHIVRNYHCQPQETHHKGEAMVHSNLTKEQYSKMVQDAKEYIRNGDIFQIVLSQRFEISNPPDSFSVYRRLRATNPSANEKVLLADPKERAEHTMLVDLGRNDVGKVCEFGSVEVTRYMVTERASKVMHLVSDVEGRLRSDQTALDALMAILPAGTLSGAPKVRAMELIDQFENKKRGLYGGTVGYLGFDGNINTCIAIRTVLFANDKAYVQAGAGIVADSVPENEYYETVNKALAVINAIKEAEQ